VGELSGRGSWGFRVIGAFKVLTGVVLLGLGLGIFHLLNRDLGEWLAHLVSLVRLDPHNRLIHTVLSRVAGLDSRQLKELGLGTFFYAFLHIIEGTGLLLRRRWAGYLVIVATGSLIPLEFYEAVKRWNTAKLAVIVVNVGIVVYLIVKLRQENRDEASRPAWHEWSS
jgi:uncharacterized membrane protein (DUF2068 family)